MRSDLTPVQLPLIPEPTQLSLDQAPVQHIIVDREDVDLYPHNLTILTCACGFWQQRIRWDMPSTFLRLDVNHAHANWFAQHNPETVS